MPFEVKRVKLTTIGVTYKSKLNMKTFDWEIAAKNHRPDYFAFLKENHSKNMNEEAFVSQVKSLGGTRRTPSELKYRYQNLKTKFGFFE